MRSIHPSPARGNSEAGFSLVEGLIAAALLLVIAVSVLPLFTRALESNIHGGRSSQLSTFASADIESVNQAPVDQDDWDVGGTIDGTLDLDGSGTGACTTPPCTTFWDIGPLFDTVGVPDTLGDERWVDNETDAEGPVLWARDISLRKFSLADIQILIGTDTAEDPLAAVGNPMLFDTPLTNDEGAHFVDLRVSIRENRDSLVLGGGQRITIGHFRSY